MLDYNVPGGKLNRGMAVYDVLASIKGPEVRCAERRTGQRTTGQGTATGRSLPAPLLLGCC